MRKKYYLIVIITSCIVFLLVKFYTWSTSDNKVWSKVDRLIDEADKPKHNKLERESDKFDLAIGYKNNIRLFKNEIIKGEEDQIYSNVSLLESNELPPDCQEIIDKFIKSTLQESNPLDSLTKKVDELEKKVIGCIYDNED